MADIRLDRQRYDELIKTERDLLELLPVMDKLEECGEDCSSIKEVVRQYVERIGKVKQHFGAKPSVG